VLQHTGAGSFPLPAFSFCFCTPHAARLRAQQDGLVIDRRRSSLKKCASAGPAVRERVSSLPQMAASQKFLAAVPLR
jgi:hypothetical protein